MEPEEIEAIRQILVHRKSQLEAFEQASKEGSRPVELDQTRVGRLSRMDAMQAQQMSLELARRSHQELRRIEGALRRLNSGDFGFCAQCGEAIGSGRLAVNPTATSCIRCADF